MKKFINLEENYKGKSIRVYATQLNIFLDMKALIIENRIYIREELKESLGMNFFSPFQPEREFKVYKAWKCSQIIYSRVH